MTELQFHQYMTCQWTLVGVTLLLAIIAIWGNTVRMWLRGPKLQVNLRSEKGESIKLDGVKTWYYHLLVRNIRRRTTIANHVRVVVKTLVRSSDGTMIPIPLSGPIQLAWQWEASTPQFPNIGAELTCDLGHLKAGESFKLKTIFDPNQYKFTVAKRERMIVGIIAQSDEAESNELKLEIFWDGGWSDDDPDEMLNHLVIKPITSH
jgi:hypothetical protein